MAVERPRSTLPETPAPAAGGQDAAERPQSERPNWLAELSLRVAVGALVVAAVAGIVVAALTLTFPAAISEVTALGLPVWGAAAGAMSGLLSWAFTSSHPSGPGNRRGKSDILRNAAGSAKQAHS